MTLLGREHTADRERRGSYRSPLISYLPDGQKMISGTSDRTIRTWDLQAGVEIEEARIVCGRGENVVGISRDARWVTTVTHGGDLPAKRKLKAYDVEKGIVKTFTGHSQDITCTDISPDGKLLASGSWDFTSRIWNLDTGKLEAGPFNGVDWVGSVRFSRDSKKLAVRSCAVRCLEVWDIEQQTLDIRVGRHSTFGPAEQSPVFWTTKDRTIVAAFNFSDDCHGTRTIYEFNAATLKTVGAPFKDSESEPISDLALSFDCTLLVSASFVGSDIKLWAFESRQLLASFNVKNSNCLVLSPDARGIAYSTYESAGSPPKIRICDIPPDITAKLWPSEEARSTNAKDAKIGGSLRSDATIPPATICHKTDMVSFAAQPMGHSPACVHKQEFTILRHLRKLVPSFHRDVVPLDRAMEYRGPLDCPVTSPHPPNTLSLTPPTMEYSIPGENASPSPVSPTSASTTQILPSLPVKLAGHPLWPCTSTYVQRRNLFSQRK